MQTKSRTPHPLGHLFDTYSAQWESRKTSFLDMPLRRRVEQEASLYWMILVGELWIQEIKKTVTVTPELRELANRIESIKFDGSDKFFKEYAEFEDYLKPLRDDYEIHRYGEIITTRPSTSERLRQETQEPLLGFRVFVW